MQVGILINCAGMFQPHPDYIEAMPDQRMQDMVTLNSLVPTMVSRWCRYQPQVDAPHNRSTG